MISAKTARGLAKQPAFLKSLDDKIRRAATQGEPHLYIKGEIDWQIHKILRDTYDFQVSYDKIHKRTHIWWGN